MAALAAAITCASSICFGQEFVDDGDLRVFLLGELSAPGAGVDRRGLLAGFHHLGQERELVGAADDLAGPARLDLSLLQRGHDETQGADANLVAALHRLLHPCGHGVAQRR